MVNLQEDFEILDELIRKAYDLISPLDHHDDLKFLTIDYMMDDAKKNPGCYLKIKKGRDHTLFPICNRSGIKTTQMIKFSLKMANKLYDKEDVDNEELDKVVSKLNFLLRRYNSPASPIRAVVNKIKSTRKFNKNMGM